jgi:hypothetical protein
MKIETRFKQLRRAFRLIDLDKSGSCDRAEVRQMLQHLFNCQVDHGPMELLLDLLDFDGSGHIELREFARFFTNDGERIDLRERLAQILDLPLDRVSVKATTTEGMGFDLVGRRFLIGLRNHRFVE